MTSAMVLLHPQENVIPTVASFLRILYFLTETFRSVRVVGDDRSNFAEKLLEANVPFDALLFVELALYESCFIHKWMLKIKDDKGVVAGDATT